MQRHYQTVLRLILINIIAVNPNTLTPSKVRQLITQGPAVIILATFWDDWKRICLYLPLCINVRLTQFHIYSVNVLHDATDFSSADIFTIDVFRPLPLQTQFLQSLEQILDFCKTLVFPDFSTGPLIQFKLTLHVFYSQLEARQPPSAAAGMTCVTGW